jgi:hypothetical protein
VAATLAIDGFWLEGDEREREREREEGERERERKRERKREIERESVARGAIFQHGQPMQQSEAVLLLLLP